MNYLFFKNRQEWRKWLKKNHQKAKEVWLLYYKKHTGKPSITHGQAVEEALCFGWIDSRIKRIDEQRFIQKYSPRRDKSVWSKINKDAAKKLIKEGKMMPAGLAKIAIAKRAGSWQSAYTSKKKQAIPKELKEVLVKDKNAWKNFRYFANTYQNMYIGWVTDAKSSITKRKRIKSVFENSLKNKKSNYF